MTEIKIENEHVFRDVDTSGVAPHLIAYLEAVAALPEVRAVHEITAAMLDAQPGERVLEVGCGLGADARELAERVLPAGEVVAIDLSKAMVEAARERHDERLPVTYDVADVTALPYDDASFDVVRIERVLQHVPDAALACREIARVLKPGGRVLAYDTDWGSFSVSIADTALAERCLAHIAGRFINRRAGLDQRAYLARAGLDAATVTPHAFVYTSLAQAAVPVPMLNDQLPPEADFVPLADRDAWFAAVEAADADGTLVVAWNGYSVLARKPS
ncbi:MAG TPA: methyltransferase domain-containing protein [Frankiaceae bacterium]|nr:methyltransferase domain-containing protein [Frankiaceae bacterium]